MPRVTYITGKKPEKPNYLAAVFSAYREAMGVPVMEALEAAVK